MNTWHSRIHIHIYACKNIYIHMHMYLYTYTDIYMPLYIYKYVHIMPTIYTYTHRYPFFREAQSQEEVRLRRLGLGRYRGRGAERGSGRGAFMFVRQSSRAKGEEGYMAEFFLGCLHCKSPTISGSRAGPLIFGNWYLDPLGSFCPSGWGLKFGPLVLILYLVGIQGFRIKGPY